MEAHLSPVAWRRRVSHSISKGDMGYWQFHRHEPQCLDGDEVEALYTRPAVEGEPTREMLKEELKNSTELLREMIKKAESGTHLGTSMRHTPDGEVDEITAYVKCSRFPEAVIIRTNKGEKAKYVPCPLSYTHPAVEGEPTVGLCSSCYRRAEYMTKVTREMHEDLFPEPAAEGEGAREALNIPKGNYADMADGLRALVADSYGTEDFYGLDNTFEEIADILEALASQAPAQENDV